jgi:hypothetical protein
MRAALQHAAAIERPLSRVIFDSDPLFPRRIDSASALKLIFFHQKPQSLSTNTAESVAAFQLGAPTHKKAGHSLYAARNARNRIMPTEALEFSHPLAHHA